MSYNSKQGLFFLHMKEYQSYGMKSMILFKLIKIEKKVTESGCCLFLNFCIYWVMV